MIIKICVLCSLKFFITSPREKNHITKSHKVQLKNTNHLYNHDANMANSFFGSVDLFGLFTVVVDIAKNIS